MTPCIERIRIPVLALVAAFFIALSGCTAGSGDQSTQGPPIGQPKRVSGCPASGLDVAGTSLPAPPPAKPLYVALGDSYSSGEGAPFETACGPEFLRGTMNEGQAGSTVCHRSAGAWPVKVWQELGSDYGLDFHACSGATINDFYGPNHAHPREEPQPQSHWLALSPTAPNADVKLVTLTFGGNDVDFSETMDYCANLLSNQSGSCLAGQAIANEKIVSLGGEPGSWPGHRTLAEFYSDLRTAAPAARVLVVGYPRLFPASPPRTGCGGDAGRNFSEIDMIGLNQTADAANRAIKTAARAAGFEYVDVGDVMAGHDVCASDNWINRALTHAVQQSFHPNSAGQRAIAARVLACVRTKACGASPADFQVFGRSRGSVQVDGTTDSVTVTPPLGADRYSALWGLYFAGQGCATTVEFDVVAPTSPPNSNFGFAVAPRSGLAQDQPVGASVQYEQEAPPDFPVLGTFVRPALLPGGAWTVDVSPKPAPLIAGRTRHVSVSGVNRSLTIKLDGELAASYSQSGECGGVSIRVWGSPFTFENLSIRSS
ncbi:SGNH/GDSL hydrolase family protein [Streptomyces sp. NBC_01296]|uniref:SGNH/GDSL hydrolase family protein n=1 Tax=Streptomyces sp. NBC_01296 TaxID=2903816 RepID=UPI002E100C2E|nr:SGNH/GDSL hydrolase family protein [Streptomyces sp. NBC_01296]